MYINMYYFSEKCFYFYWTINNYNQNKIKFYFIGKIYYVTKKGKHPFIDLDPLVVILRRPVPLALCSRPSGVHA
jgi:hypothetical protein